MSWKTNVENPSELSLSKEVLEAGLTDESIRRIIFRLNFVEKSLEERKKVLVNGNLARLEPEIIQIAHSVQDLCDTVREFITLFHQEQGVALPPNPIANGDETPNSR